MPALTMPPWSPRPVAASPGAAAVPCAGAPLSPYRGCRHRATPLFVYCPAPLLSPRPVADAHPRNLATNPLVGGHAGTACGVLGGHGGDGCWTATGS